MPTNKSYEFHPEVIDDIIKSSSMERNKGKDLGRYTGCKSIFEEDSGYVLSQALGQRNYGLSITEYKSGPFSRMY